MNEYIISNLILDSAGIVILLLFLIPFFVRQQTVDINRRKRRFLLYATMTHFFVLAISLTGTIILMTTDSEQTTKVCGRMSTVLFTVSVLLLVACVLCNENGIIRIPKGMQIPVGQIIWSVLPPILAFCLGVLFPGYHFLFPAWAISLNLNNSFIMMDSERKLAETEKHLGLTRAAQMALQMQPHFIFNTLSSIESLCQTDPQTAAECVENLAGYLRGNIDAMTVEGLIPFDEEMQHIRQYIALEQADPSRQFSFEYELDVRDFSLPALTVQPLVENAVKHGALTRRDGSGRVVLTTEKIGRTIRIIVTDNGTESSLTDAQRETNGIGIEYTRKRIETVCGGSLNIIHDECGTRAVILIPQAKG